MKISREIHATVWRLAWPSVLTMLLQTFNGLLDTLFVGHLPNSSQALAATNIGGQILFLLISVAMGVSVGTTALVARFTGAKVHEDRLHATAQSLTLSLILSLVCFLLFFVSRHTIIGLMLSAKDAPGTGPLCEQFITIALFSTVPLFLMNVLMGAFRGLGDTRTPMLIQVATIGTHITFNWLLITGRLGFPRLEVAGAATALSLSILVGFILYAIALVRVTPLGATFTREYLKFDTSFTWYRRILKIGIPASIQAVIRSLGMMSFTGMLARTAEGANAVAAMGIGIRAEALAFMPGFGYSVAASALVGQYLGAKNTPDAEKSAWAATLQAILVMTFMSVCFYLGANHLAAIFSSSPEVRTLGADYLRINALCEPFLALGMVFTGALQGAGDTVRPTFITLFTMWIVRIPLGSWLMFHLNMQTEGAWWAMSITTITGGILTLLLFQQGGWKKIKV